MISALFFENVTFEWWHLAVVVGFLLLSIYDNDQGLAQEIEYTTRKNTIFMEMYRIIKKLGEKENDKD